MKMRRLPPLNALRAFEAAARHGGFIGASEELHVTRGAVSRHVKLLEEHLGLPLFIRQAQGVRLTAPGRRLLPILTEAFEKISQGAGMIARASTELRIICPPATSMRWLLPRLDDFRDRHPDIQLRVTTDFFADGGFDPTEFDIGFSVTNWPRRSSDIEVLTLFPVCLTPACAPSYLARHPLPSPEALSDCELLHETTGRADWTAWIDAFIPRGLQRASVQDFSNLDMAVKAAVMGVGVVMADLVLCREELDAGTLVTPFPDMACASPCGGICLIADRERWSVPKVEAFRLWAMNAARQDQVEVEDLKAVSQ